MFIFASRDNVYFTAFRIILLFVCGAFSRFPPSPTHPPIPEGVISSTPWEFKNVSNLHPPPKELRSSPSRSERKNKAQTGWRRLERERLIPVRSRESRGGFSGSHYDAPHPWSLIVCELSRWKRRGGLIHIWYFSAARFSKCAYSERWPPFDSMLKNGIFTPFLYIFSIKYNK